MLMALLHSVFCLGPHGEEGEINMATGIMVSCGQAGELVLLLFQTLLTACDLRMKFLMPFPLPICIDHTLLWD